MKFNYSDILTHLNMSYFQKVWNSVRDEDRVNMKLHRLTERMSAGVIALRYGNITLPKPGSFATFTLPKMWTRPLITIPQYEWVAGNKLIESNFLNMFVYDLYGRVIPNHTVWFYNPGGTKLIVAIERHALDKCTFDKTKCQPYITLFNDTIRKTKTICYNKSIIEIGNVDEDIKDTYTTIYPILKENSPTTIFYVNGYTYTADSFPVLVRGDFVEIRTDSDIVIAYTVPIDDNTNGYYSELYNGPREIIHTPKELNPNNVVLTHNGASFFVRDPVTNKGLYYHRAHDLAVENITHNDFSLHRDVLEHIKAALGATEVVVDVKIRQPRNPTILLYDHNSIYELYNDSDANIYKHLRGTIDSSLYFWKASHLEKSPYIKMMFRMTDATTEEQVNDYVMGLGYYEIGSLLGYNNKEYEYLGGDIIAHKPYIMIESSVYVYIYDQFGKKLPDHYFSVDNSASYVKIKIRSDIKATLYNTTITLGMSVKNEKYQRIIHPTLENPAFELSNSDVFIYEIYEFKSPLQDYKLCYGKDYLYGYTPTNRNNYEITTGSDNKVLINFNSAQVDRDYIIIEEINSRYLYFEIKTILEDTNAIILNLSKEFDNNGITINVPPLDNNSSKVFLNGYWLIEGIDYNLSTVYDAQNRIVDQLLIISNKTYIDFDDLSKNYVEVYLSSDKVLSNKVGFTEEGYLKRTTNPCVWYDRIGWLFISGKRYNSMSVKPTHFTMLQNPSTGEPYDVHLDWDYRLNRLLNPLNDYGDEELKIQHAILEYYHRSYPKTSTIQPVFKQHAIYSPFIMRIISDIRDKKITPSDDVNTASFLKQFEPYQSLMDSDPTLSTDNPVERTLVSVGASYTQIEGFDETNTRIIMRLIRLTLNRAQHTIGETYV